MRYLPAVVAVGALLTVAACGDASSSSSSGSGGGGASATAPAADQSLSYTLSTTSISGLGTVLVNGNGRTLYILTSEKGGKVTCTDASGCTAVWPDTGLPSGVSSGIAGGGVQASLLGTTKGADGETYLTYATYPLYTYKGDSGAGTASGEGIQSFGGTWYAIGADGNPITSAGGAAGATPYGGGY